MPSAPKEKQRIKTYGWVMNWKPIRTVEGDQFGEELTIKTMFKKKFGTETMSVYIANLIIRDPEMIESIITSKVPTPVLVEGTKKWEKIYSNIESNDIETTKKLVWIGLNRRGLSVKILDDVPKSVLEKTGVDPPPMTFRDYQKLRPKAV